MNLIIPMAGQGKRLRPHTLTVPKPLLPIAGKPIVERIFDEITQSLSNTPIDNVGFIYSDLTLKDKTALEKIGQKINAKVSFFRQEEPLGTAHAIHQANELLQGPVIITFSDTLFKGKLDVSAECDGVIWTKTVEDPSSFGVVGVNDRGEILNIVEKPTQFVSNEAIVGIYYFKEGKVLKEQIDTLIKEDIRVQGEYQLTSAIKNILEKHLKIINQPIDKWLDCGNKEAIIHTHQNILNELGDDHKMVSGSALLNNTILIPPVYVGDNVVLNNSVVGPYVSLGENCNIYDSRIDNSIIQSHTNLKNINLKGAMLGSFVNFIGKPTDASIGDYSSTIIG